MEPLMPLWRDHEIAFLQGAGSPNKTRSHFVQMDLIESGTPESESQRKADGYLNRGLQALMTRSPANSSIAFAIQPIIPFSLIGTAPAVAMTDYNELAKMRWASGVTPGLNLEQRIRGMFVGPNTPSSSAKIRVAGRRAIEAALTAQSIVGSPPDVGSLTSYGGPGIGASMRQIAMLLAKNSGVQIITTDLNGWDTHIRQGVLEGEFNKNLSALSNALSTFRQDARRLGFWNRLVVVVMSEFGRRARQNGTGGTDHGRGGVMAVMGGKVQGGNVIAPNFNLTNLDESLDVRVEVDYRSVMQELMQKHIGLSSAEIQNVFPGFDGHSYGIYHG